MKQRGSRRTTGLEGPIEDAGCGTGAEKSITL
jgi:hypothetical protein